MKKILNYSGLLIILSFALAITAYAQNEQPVKYKNPSWLPAGGYWVVISNTKNLKSNEVCFYTTSNELIYKEKIEGVKMNIKKTRVKKQLKKAFDQAYLMWTSGKLNMENQTFIAKLIQ